MTAQRRALLIESPRVRALVAAGELEAMDADPIITPALTAFGRAEVKRGRTRGKRREAQRARADREAGVETVRHRALT